MAKFDVTITREYSDQTNETGRGDGDTPMGTLVVIAVAIIGIVIFMVSR